VPEIGGNRGGSASERRGGGARERHGVRAGTGAGEGADAGVGDTGKPGSSSATADGLQVTWGGRAVSSWAGGAAKRMVLRRNMVNMLLVLVAAEGERIAPGSRVETPVSESSSFELSGAAQARPHHQMSRTKPSRAQRSAHAGHAAGGARAVWA
jgi:hypothetical protein